MKRKKASVLPLTCGECEHGVLSLPPPHLRCGRDRVLDRGVEADKAPPAWCPLRNRPKKLDGSPVPVLLRHLPPGDAAERVEAGMVSVHCADDMPEIERLRARVAELEARSAKLRAERERVAPLETVDCHCCHRVRPGYPGFDRCAECAESLGEDQIAAMFREARERVAELVTAFDAERSERRAVERQRDEALSEVKRLRAALERATRVPTDTEVKGLIIPAMSKAHAVESLLDVRRAEAMGGWK